MKKANLSDGVRWGLACYLIRLIQSSKPWEMGGGRFLASSYGWNFEVYGWIVTAIVEKTCLFIIPLEFFFSRFGIVWS